MNDKDNTIDKLFKKLVQGELTSEEAVRFAHTIHTSARKEHTTGRSAEKIEKLYHADQRDHHIESYIVEKLRPFIKGVLSLERNFMDLGVESSQLIEIAQQIEQDLNIELYPTLFFEYQNIKELANYFKEKHAETMSRYLHSEEEPSSPCAITPDAGSKEKPAERNTAPEDIVPKQAEYREVTIIEKKDEATPLSTYPKAIAIIGMAGNLADSSNLNEFWEHIKASRDLVKEIPSNRWDYRPWFDKNIDASNKTYSKWGSFLDDIDKFDPLFFGISGREAVWLDPQLRLLLQVIQETIEDAGYGQRIFGTKTGVYVGVMFQEYWDEIVRAHIPINDYELSSNPMSSLSARISYTYDLQGASIPLDNACASSLTAMHLACRALQWGECDMAFVAGTNLLLSPLHYVNLSRMRALSPTGRCHTFDKAADGYVPGEGVAALLLKPLSKALEDEDTIHAIIKGTAINHVGRSNNPTSPRPELQTRLLINAWEDAGINPESISYLEAHGTGTKLGDPIEINALKKAFSAFTTKRGFCPIGSTKAHIGHLEGAAGVASVVKVIMSMKNKQIPAMPNFKELNPYIQLEDSPFYINTELQEWTPAEDAPRRAGISSFGMFGNNAHIIIEEFIPSHAHHSVQSALRMSVPQLFILSASDEERLRAYAEKMADFLEKHSITNSINLSDLAYTMQVGRAAMEERMAVVISNIQELIDALRNYVQGESASENIYRGNIRNDNATTALLIEGKEGEEFIKIIMGERKLAKLGQLWVLGIEMDWKALYPDHTPNLISLPTYPFAKERYWMPDVTKRISAAHEGSSQVTKLHPLIDQNISTLYEAHFLTRLKGDEFFLEDHRVDAKKVVPGVGYIEMGRAAGELAGEKKVKRIRDILWTRPITVTEASQEVHISLHPDHDVVKYEIWTKGGGNNRVVHSQGTLVYENQTDRPSKIEVIDIRAIEKRCPHKRDAKDCYNLFKEKALQYGPCFQAIQTLASNDTEAISFLALPAPCRDEFHDFMLHPSLMDAGLQTVMGLMATIDPDGLYLPFSLGEVDVIKPLPETCYAYVTLAENQHTHDSPDNRFHILLVDKSGEVVVKMNNFSARAFQRHTVSASSSSLKTGTSDVLYYDSVWEKDGQASKTAPQGLAGHTLIFDTNDTLYTALQQKIAGNGSGRSQLVMVKPGTSFKDFGNCVYELDPTRKDHYGELLETLTGQDIIPSRILYLWAEDHFTSTEETIRSQLDRGVYPLVYLSQALLDQNLDHDTSILYVYQTATDSPHPLYAAISGLAKTMHKENPKIACKVVEIQRLATAHSALPVSRSVDIILSELNAAFDDNVEVCYKSDGRWIKRLQEFDLEQEAERNKTRGEAALLQDKGVYIITGGAGGLGLIFAEYLAKRVKARLVLTGRSELSDEKKAMIQELESLGSEIVYIKADISKRKDVENLITETKHRFGGIQGIIHSAGVVRDAFIVRKTKENIEEVVAPKVFGTLYLDEATSEEQLDFFVLFSSIAGVLGNPGQADYAYANSFMDNFAVMREDLRRKGVRCGKTVSIIWPLWKEGGMHVSAQVEEMLAETIGMAPLKTLNGLNAFAKGLSLEKSQFVVVEGNRQKLRQVIESDKGKDAAESVSTVDQSMPLAEGNHFIEEKIVETLVSVLGIAANKIDFKKPFAEYGVDSIIGVDLVNRLNKVFGSELKQTIIFNYGTVNDLSRHIYEKYAEKIAALAPAKHPTHSVNEMPQLTFHTIFLTGATGILGGYILKELLETTDFHIYCLIRAHDTVHAKERLKEVLKIYDAQDRVLAALGQKVVPIIGDIREKNLGLTHEEYQQLVNSVDCTIHVAASTNLVMPYDYLASINVQGVKNIIDFALQTKQKYLLHMSSYHVMADVVYRSNFAFTEKHFDVGQKFPNMGYQQTKFEGERLVREASKDGLLWNIFRPGNIFGEAKGGLYPLELSGSASIFHRLFELIIKSGVAAAGKYYFDVTPVDYITKATLFLGLKRKSFFETYHLLNTDKKQWHEIITLVNKCGYTIDLLPVDDYLDMVYHDNLPLDEEVAPEWLNMMKYGFATKEFFLNDGYADATYTQSVLKKEKINCPKIDVKLLGTYLEYYASKGIIPQPSKQESPRKKASSRVQAKKKITPLRKSTGKMVVNERR
ncbi:MAG: thioester reductase domain-containing protein [bacterium]